MPIRFRCEHCNQLLGIARRKAGTQVDCPKCSKPTTVPEEQEPIPVITQSEGDDAPLLERADFDELLDDPKLAVGGVSILGMRPVPPPIKNDSRQSSRDKYDVEPVGPTLAPAETASVVLTSRQATWLTVAAIFSMVVAFGAGLLVGRFLL